MKTLLLVALLSTLTLQQTLLLASSSANTIITSPAGLNIGVDPYHNAHHPNFIGDGAQWLWQTGGASWSDGQTLVFQTQFYAPCEGLATLTITADNKFSAVLNGGAPLTGDDWTKKYTFPLTPLKCGKNVLVITAINYHEGTPAALIFSVTQDQSTCFQCKTPLSYFNRNTCQCECNKGCDCASRNSLYVWNDYPVCGCSCGVKAKCAANRYFDESSCNCACLPQACQDGYEQDPNSCECLKSKPKCDLTLIRFACQPNERFDVQACRCLPNCPIFIREPTCPPGRQWSQDKCACVCLIQICLPPARFDENTCVCRPNYYTC